jgi:hypothetical protein
VLKRHWPAVAAVTIYWTATAVLLGQSLRLNDGHLIYPLDDAYVHMAIARNVALHHVWGVVRDGFSSSTSSPLWTLMLALTYFVLGVGAAAPLVINFVAGSLIVVTIGHFMRAQSAGAPLTFAVLLAAIFIAPLPTLTLAGMEHTLHALVTVWFAFTAASLLASNRPATKRDLAMAGLLSALAVGLRYEGMFAVGVAALLFMLTRRWAAAGVVAAAGTAPVVAYGLWSMMHGWYFFPNSVLLKGQVPSLDLKAILAFAAGSPALHNLVGNPHMLLIVVAALALLLVATTAPVWNEDVFLLTILIGTSLLHMQLARAGWFYRYEAYLLVLGAAVFGVIAANRLPSFRTWARGSAVLPRLAGVATLFVVAGFPFVSRGVNALRTAPTAASNIYRQQYQVGLFLDRFYTGRSVAVNDIGAVAYLADVKLFDIFGLASLEIAQLKRAGRYESRELAAFALRHDTEIAIVYPSWLGEYGGVPAGWTKVGEWGVADNVVLGENAVSFYAVKADQRPRLVENLRRFAPGLPGAVRQAGEYTK